MASSSHCNKIIHNVWLVYNFMQVITAKITGKSFFDKRSIDFEMQKNFYQFFDIHTYMAAFESKNVHSAQ